MLVFGDVHIGRGLPHTSTEEGKDHRYEFLKGLLERVLSGGDEFLFLGDITDKANQFDGKVFEDMYKIFKGKDIKIILGNHDRSKDGSKHTSLAEALALSIDSVEVITGVKTFTPRTSNIKCIATSYYAEEEEIMKAVQNVSGQAIVFGHWNFWNDLHKSGKNLKSFAKKQDVKWVLGHEHNPNKIDDIGYYLGVMNPKIFGESQGRVMKVGSSIKFLSYPDSEVFIKGYYTDEEVDMPDIEKPERTYLKVYTDDSNKLKEIRAKYEDMNLRHFSMPLIQKEEIAEDVSFEEHINKTVDDHVVEAIKANEFNPDELMPVHQEIKEKTPL